MNTPRPEQTTIAIIGGGITGLSVTWNLQQAGIDYMLLEASDRWGGKIRTEYVDGFADEPFVIEVGPDSMLTQKPWGWQFAHELGLEDRLLGTNDAQRNIYVLNDGKMTLMPDGLLLIVPTKLMPFVRSTLISPLGKLRMGLDLFIRPKRDNEDETLTDFIGRRLGREALDKLAEPLLAGIYSAEPERLSIMATFPRFRVMEQQYGGLIRGMIAARKTRSTQGNHQSPTTAFVSFIDGMSELVDAIVSQLNGMLCLETAVQHIERLDNGDYGLSLSDGSKLIASKIIMTTPAYVTADLLNDLAPESAKQLKKIRYVSTGTISFGFRSDNVPHLLDGFGVIIPRTEQRRINAMTWTSTKFKHRAPTNHALIRVFFGGSRNPDMMQFTDEELVSIAREELHDILGIQAAPFFHRLYRWPHANPQYDVGHLERIAAVEDCLPDGIYVTGSAIRGVGIPDCVHQAQQLVASITQQLTTD